MVELKTEACTWTIILYDCPDPLKFVAGKPDGVAVARRRWTWQGRIRTRHRIWLTNEPLTKRKREAIQALLREAAATNGEVVIVSPAVLWEWLSQSLDDLDRHPFTLNDSYARARHSASRIYRAFLDSTSGTNGRRAIPPMTLHFFQKGTRQMGKVIIAARLEIDAFDAVAFDVDLESGSLTLSEKEPYEFHISAISNGTELTDKVVLFLNRFRLASRIPQDDILAYAISMPGIIDSEAGIVVRSGRFGIRPPEPPVEAARIWSERVGAPVYVFHDGPSLALGEMKHGAGKDKDLDTGTFVFITVGEGIGSSLFIDGKYYRGASGVAGEFGRIVLDPAGPFSAPAGNNGCVEVYTTRPWINQNIMNHFPKARSGGYSTSFAFLLQSVSNPMEITTEMLQEASQDGDPLVNAQIDEAAKKLGQAISMIVTFFNPPVIVLGGELMDKLERYYEETEKQIAVFTFQEALKRDDPPRPGTEVLRAQLGAQAQWFGSAEQALMRARSNTSANSSASIDGDSASGERGAVAQGAMSETQAGDGGKSRQNG